MKQDYNMRQRKTCRNLECFETVFSTSIYYSHPGNSAESQKYRQLLQVSELLEVGSNKLSDVLRLSEASFKLSSGFLVSICLLGYVLKYTLL